REEEHGRTDARLLLASRDLAKIGRTIEIVADARDSLLIVRPRTDAQNARRLDLADQGVEEEEQMMHGLAELVLVRAKRWDREVGHEEREKRQPEEDR